MPKVPAARSHSFLVRAAYQGVAATKSDDLPQELKPNGQFRTEDGSHAHKTAVG
jgi:hypothetical protein